LRYLQSLHWELRIHSHLTSPFKGEEFVQYW
jgi:hypothetical protein